MILVGHDEYDIDENGGEDDAGHKNNYENNTMRTPTCFVRLLAQLSKWLWEVVLYDVTSTMSMRMAVRMMLVANTIVNKMQRNDRHASSDC